MQSVPWPGSSSELKSPPTMGMYFLAICRVLLGRFVHFFDVVVCRSQVEEVHTHQFDALAVYNDRGSDGPFVDVFSINSSLPPFLVQHNSSTVFVVVLSCSHECVCDVSPRFLTCLVSTFRSRT